MSPDVIKEQAAILRKIMWLKERLAEVQAELDLNWDRFNEIAIDIAGEDETYKYVDSELKMVLSRQVARSDRLDEAKLFQDLPKEQWMEITKVERHIDNDLLERAVAQGRVETEVVAAARIVKFTPSRIGPKAASKDDLAALAKEALT